MSLKPRAWKTITWREGTNAPLSGRFAALRGRPSTLPANSKRAALVGMAKRRWRVERHVTNSIATVRRAIAVHLARTRPRCPSRAVHVVQGDGKGQVDSDTYDALGLE